MNGEPSQCLCWAADTTTIGAMETCPVHGDSGRHYIDGNGARLDLDVNPGDVSVENASGVPVDYRYGYVQPVDGPALFNFDTSGPSVKLHLDCGSGEWTQHEREPDALAFQAVEFPTDNLAARIRGWDPRATWHNGMNRAQRRARRK